MENIVIDSNEQYIVTVADIQAKKTSGESCDTRVRKAWSLQMTAKQRSKFENFPGFVKIQLYKGFDKEVLSIWIDMMRQYNRRAIESGAKFVKVNGFSRFEDSWCTDVDEMLLVAAQLWLDEFDKRSAK